MWLNQTVQNNNKTTLSVTNSKIDCAKECPCGVPSIPVPDQWLEVMVTGGFKVWHIIFIIIAFIVTTIVIYCCIHRCRIPRTKQEIEADLMRSNLSTKFRDYLQELPNEPLTFTEALKKVQEIEEKLEQDDAQMSRELGARKRMGWIKLKGKDKDGPNKDKDQDKDKDKESDKIQQPEDDGSKKEVPPEAGQANGITQPAAGTTPAPPATGPETGTTNQTGKPPANGQLKAQPDGTMQSDPVAPTDREAKKENNNSKRENNGKQQRSNGRTEPEHDVAEGDKQPTKALTTPVSKGRRRQKPNLSRTKLAKERPLLVESSDNLERPAERPSHLELPDPTTRRNHKKKLKSDKNRPDEHQTEHKNDQ